MKLRMIKSRRLIKFARNESGGTLAELAILVPLLAVMLAAVSEFGRYFQSYTTLAKSTRSAARYLSNHPLTDVEKDKARNLAVCGKLTACGSDKLVPGIDVTKVCIETAPAEGKVTSVTVRIPRTGGGEGDCGGPVLYQPIFNIGALLHNSLSMNLPIAPSVTMRYVVD